MTSIQQFNTLPFIQALKGFFKELHIPIDYIADEHTSAKDILNDKFNDNNEAHKLINEVYALGIVNNAIFEGNTTFESLKAVKEISADYEGLLIFGITLNSRPDGLLPTRSQLAEITRIFNRVFPYTPVTIVFKYDTYISLANSERVKYLREWREGEKVGRVTLLKDINYSNPHTAHTKILSGLSIEKQKVGSFIQLYNYWQSVFSLQALNDQFYADLQAWFYYASQHIKLPFKPDYINEKENTKNFLVRLLARTMFCWFVKEKGLIKPELLELTDWDNTKYNLTNDIESADFLQSNSYYRGILQNIFYNALNQKEKKSIKDFKWIKYLHPDFQLDWLIQIPYLNGGIFDKLEEDNAKESIEDTVMQIPNFLFYGINSEEITTKGKGARSTQVVEKVEHKGLNGILKSYKFTLEENTPFEEDIALDPELLGLVFENLLAELDPNLEESTIKSIRKLTGSYYTPRKMIQEMVNDSLFLYITNFIKKQYSNIQYSNQHLSDLIHFSKPINNNPSLCAAVVNALDKFKMLDPACGSGAFPMGMLHRMVDILKLVDVNNTLWLELKLKNIDFAQKAEFEKVLKQHLNDYSRKLGIIRDSIYGIDIQPLAVQITKLRFFISLLIDQKVEKGITPMPNIETKIICADSLKDVQPDLFSSDSLIAQLQQARIKYYQPDISVEDRKIITDEIIDLLDRAFPTFARQITNKNISGQNKVMLREWFTHATIAAPFFNLDFFYPEIRAVDGFDCIIGNPPYGGFKITDEVRTNLGIESKDPYGAFVARFMNKADKHTPLKKGGVLAYIISDTFMTIKSHLPLRKMLMQNYIHKMIRVHPDTFRATVNTVVMIAERNIYEKDPNGKSIVSFDDQHICQMADLTNLSIHDAYDEFMQVLSQTKAVFFENTVTQQNTVNQKYAIYYYPQALICTNSNLPFFVASPKLFALMNDSSKDLKKELKEIGDKQVQVRKIQMNEKEIEVVKLGDIADVRKGIDTGDNHKFLLQNTESRGSYNDVSPFEEYILSEEELRDISKNYELKEIIKFKGFSQKPGEPNYYKGKYIIPYEKGGEGDIESGWLPNYYVPNSYYIDWSVISVRNLFSAQNNDNNQSTLRNKDYWFKLGLTFSLTGYYAPTVRLKSPSMFDNKSSGIFTSYDELISLSILTSKIQRFLMKNFLMHTVDTQVGVFDDSPFIINSNNERILRQKIEQIIKKQKSNPRYDYASDEQIEIDKLVYEAYGLSADDVQEVENWYARRYPKLSNAQKANLRALGKSDDYLELYGLK